MVLEKSKSSRCHWYPGPISRCSESMPSWEEYSLTPTIRTKVDILLRLSVMRGGVVDSTMTHQPLARPSRLIKLRTPSLGLRQKSSSEQLLERRPIFGFL